MGRMTILGAAGVVAAAVALAAHAATTAAPSPGVQRAVIADAIADEERAWRALARSEPRRETARLLLGTSLTRLRELRPDIDRREVRANVDTAISLDIEAIASLNKRQDEKARRAIELGISFKSQGRLWLTQPRVGAPQCADGRDNDGDGLADNAFDSGCSSGKDATERSPLACTLGIDGGGVEGTCSGPFERLQIVLPRDGFDTTKPPTASFAGGCRYASERKLECIFRDGQVNPGHRLHVRFKLDVGTIRAGDIRVFDFRGRRFGVRPKAAAPAPAPAFQLAAYATYAHGSSSSNVCVFVWTVPGQPPLRGGVTLTGPIGEQTNPFTTLGGDRKTRVIFSVPQRGRYVADVTLAGKTAQAAVALGLAPTPSGEYACPAP